MSFVRKAKLPENSIKAGEPITHDVYSKEGVLLLRKGQVISSEEKALSLNEAGYYFTENRKSTKSVDPFVITDKAYQRLLVIFESTIAEKYITQVTLDLARDLQIACAESEDAALSTLMLSRDGSYASWHSIHSAIIAEIVLKAEGWTADSRLSVVSAALTMNIGMWRLQDDLQDQPAPLSDSQRNTVAHHPQKSVEILKLCGVEDTVWLEAVLRHHEAHDGSGYPFGLSGNDISIGAKVIAMADNYCAKVQGRTYRPALSASIAVREIFDGRGKYFEEHLGERFVELLGLYPPGSVIRLHNGEICIVVKRSDEATSPTVLTLVSPHSDHIHIVRETSDKEYRIKTLVNPKDLQIQIDRHSVWSATVGA